jgi:hypothetical protein
VTGQSPLSPLRWGLWTSELLTGACVVGWAFLTLPGLADWTTYMLEWARGG